MPNYLLEETKIEFIRLLVEADSIHEAQRGNFRVLAYRDTDTSREFEVLKEVKGYELTQK